MALTHTFYRSWTRPGESIVKAVERTAGAEVNIDETIPADTADVAVAFAMDVSQCKGLYLVSDVDVVIETNSSGSPVNTFTLTAGVPYLWMQGDAAMRDTAGAAVTTDITSLFVSNADPEADALLQIRSLVDPTV
jgi:hypothetical protein